MKKGMELPTNFLIMMVLGLIMFSAAIFIAYKVFAGAEDIQNQLTASTKKEIEKKITGANGLVMLGRASLDLRRGQRDTVGVGIRNTLPASKTFYLKATCASAINAENTLVCSTDNPPGCGSVCSWILSGGSSGIKIETKTVEVLPLFINVPKDAGNGKYIFHIQACYDRDCGESGSRDYDVAKQLVVMIS
jgi:hypothetical protein